MKIFESKTYLCVRLCMITYVCMHTYVSACVCICITACVCVCKEFGYTDEASILISEFFGASLNGFVCDPLSKRLTKTYDNLL